jgi:hypothetical protein
MPVLRYVPLLPVLREAPLPPIDVLTPDFEIFNLTPFPKFIDFLNLIYKLPVSHENHPYFPGNGIITR